MTPVGEPVVEREVLSRLIVSRIREVPDYPTPGIAFKDITPLLADPQAFAAVVDAFAAPHVRAAAGVGEPDHGAVGSGDAGQVDLDAGEQVDLHAGQQVDLVAGIEARGFILAAPVAVQLAVGFVPVRKSGKLPHRTIGTAYALEYGTAELEMHADAVRPGQRVLVMDDVLATGGTAAAACELVERLGGVVVGVAVLLELSFLDGRAQLPDRWVRALVTL